MSEYKVGDYVLIRGEVVFVHEGVVRVNLEPGLNISFAKDSIVGKSDPPAPPEPTGDALVEDKDGDFWVGKNGEWVLRDQRRLLTAGTRSWSDLNATYGPLAIWNRS